MPFTDEQKIELNKKLHSSNVSTRKQAGVKLAYIEGHHAIREANRIFGFDGWNMYINSLEKTVEEETTIGVKKLPGVKVGYRAEVTIKAGDISREDVGFGSGTAKSSTDAHELAMKEAVTDGMKRALRTFGDQFGNALYDKEQKNVTDEEEEVVEKPKKKKTTKKKEKDSPGMTVDELKTLIEDCEDETSLKNFKSEYKSYIKSLSKEDSEDVIEYFTKAKNNL